MPEASRLPVKGKQESRGRALFASPLLLLAAASFACAGRPQVVIETQTGPATVNVEIAASRSKRNLGLMYRERLGSREGMLFLFPTEADHTFWMKNTKLSLDMIFIGSEMNVVGLIEGAKPFSTTSLAIGRPSRFILEVASGFVARHGVKRGDRVRFQGFDPGKIEVEP